LGQLRAAQGRWAEAETAFQRTLVACQQIAYWAPSALMCIGIARFFAERGLTAEATPLLDQAQRWLENAGYSRWLDEIARIRELPTAASKT
jgi:hypothetical protein